MNLILDFIQVPLSEDHCIDMHIPVRILLLPRSWSCLLGALLYPKGGAMICTLSAFIIRLLLVLVVLRSKLLNVNNSLLNHPLFLSNFLSNNFLLLLCNFLSSCSLLNLLLLWWCYGLHGGTFPSLACTCIESWGVQPLPWSVPNDILYICLTHHEG